MQARTFRDIEHFDGAINQLRLYFGYLTNPVIKQPRTQASRTTSKRKGEGSV